MLLQDLVFDGQYPNMRVDPAYYEPKHPLELPPPTDDPVALWRPSPDDHHLTAPILTLDFFDEVTAELSWTHSHSDAFMVKGYHLQFRPHGDEYAAWQNYGSYLITRDMFGKIVVEILHAAITLPEENGVYDFRVLAEDWGHKFAASNIVPMEVEPDPVYELLTTKLYPIEDILGHSISLAIATQPSVGNLDGHDMGFALTGGSLDEGLGGYDDWPPEGHNVAFALTDGDLDTVLVTYDDAKPEGHDIAFALTGGELDTALVSYVRYKPEGHDTAFALTGGSLS